jgi:tetratricopeptide (TPR) repeat protein
MISPDALASLEDERRVLLRSIEDLEREHSAGDISDDDYEVLKADYLLRTADVQRQIHGQTEVYAKARQDRTAKRRPWMTPVVVGLIGVGAVAAGVGVARNAGERLGDAGLTGSVRVAANPNEAKITALLEEGRAHLSDDPGRALRAFDRAVALDPAQVEAIAYGGWLVRLVSLSAEDPAQKAELVAAAKARLDAAIIVDPGYPDARAFRGILLLRDMNDPKAADADFTALQKLNPPPFIGQLTGSAAKEAKELAAATK